jgi:TRAP-type C4-dicarboxylate transport system permease small subunit
MDGYIRGIRFVSQCCGVFAATLIGLGVLVVCHMVFVRYVLNDNTIWQTDFVTYSLVAATFIGSPYLLLSRSHVNVDVLPHYVGPRMRFGLAVFSVVLSLAFSIVLTVLTFQFWHESWSNKWVSDTMWRARLWIPYASMPIGFGILTLQLVADFINLVTGRAPAFGFEPDKHA